MTTLNVYHSARVHARYVVTRKRPHGRSRRHRRVWTVRWRESGPLVDAAREERRDA